MMSTNPSPIARSQEELSALLAAHGVPAPNLDQVRRIAALSFRARPSSRSLRGSPLRSVARLTALSSPALERSSSPRTTVKILSLLIGIGLCSIACGGSAGSSAGRWRRDARGDELRHRGERRERDDRGRLGLDELERDDRQQQQRGLQCGGYRRLRDLHGHRLL